MGFFKDKAITSVDISQLETIKQEVKASQTDVTTKAAQVAQQSAQVTTDTQEVAKTKTDIETTSQNLSVELQTIRGEITDLGNKQNTLDAQVGQVGNQLTSMQQLERSVEQMKTSVEQSAVQVAQGVVNVDTDRQDAEKARDDVYAELVGLDNQFVDLNNLVSQAQVNIDASNATANDMRQLKQDVTALKGDTEAVKSQAVDAKDEAITRADEAMTYAKASENHAKAAEGFKDTAKTYLDQTLASAATVQQAVTDVAASATSAGQSAATATNQAAVATSEAAKAKQYADSLGDISSGKFGVTSLNGQSGILNMSANDFNAVSKNGDSMSGDLTFSTGMGVALDGWKVLEGSDGSFVVERGGKRLLSIYANGALNANSGVLQEKGLRVYSPYNKPTANDIGARESTWTPEWSDIRSAPTIFPSNWANLADKPVYATRWPTAAEAGALPLNGRADDSKLLDGSQKASTAVAWSVVQRDGNADILANTFRASGPDHLITIPEDTSLAFRLKASGALAFAPKANIKNWLGYTAADVGAVDAQTSPHVVEHVRGNTYWCRKWSDGFIEQGGNYNTAGVTRDQLGAILADFPVAFTDRATVSFNATGANGTSAYDLCGGVSSASQMRLAWRRYDTGATAPSSHNDVVYWQASGY